MYIYFILMSKRLQMLENLPNDALDKLLKVL